VQQNLTFKDQLYGIPNGTDGLVLYFNKKLFAQAGLPADWQPTSWDDILTAGQALKKLKGVTPIQVNAGVPMGEATTAQGFLPLLAGTGKPLYDDASGKWQGSSAGVKEVLGFYQRLYGSGLGDPRMQQDKAGRDQSFAEFSKGAIGILAEGDYFWRSVICPDKENCATTSMADRDEVVGWAKIPARQPGAGVNGQDFVSGSGGSGWMLNPGTKYPQQAWELMAFMASKEMQTELSKAQIRISARADVNAETLKNDPLLSFISSEVLPLTTFRPSDEKYNEVSLAIQQATADVVAGTSPDEAAKTYATSLEKAVGAERVDNS
jgi:multiple sugar transport system substrate-binding protein